MRSRFRVWKRWYTWALAGKGDYAKIVPSDVVQYVRDLDDSGCGPTVPGSVLASLLFVERAGGCTRNGGLTDDPLLAAAVDSIAMDIERRRGKPKQEAPWLPLMVLIALELTVVDERASRYSRFISGCRLLKWWTGMRYDDTLGLGPRGYH